MRIADGKIIQTNGTFLPANSATDERVKFEAAIRQALEKTLKSMPPIPKTQNKLKEIRLTMTFMRDPTIAPRHGKRDFGFAAVRTASGDNLIVYGRLKEGRAPGIQIISDRDGGSIQVTAAEPFLRKCDEIESRP